MYYNNNKLASCSDISSVINPYSTYTTLPITNHKSLYTVVD